MSFELFSPEDLSLLPVFEPPGWGDLIPRFSYALSHRFYRPVKLIKKGSMVAVGTVIFHEDSAWLASIIVHPDHRNKGYGKEITRGMIDLIDAKQYSTIYLDATDLGYPVYQALGFTHEANYAHFKSDTNITGLQWSTSIMPYRDEHLDQLLALDKIVSCENRATNLVEHLTTAKVFLHQNNVVGFYLPSFGNGLIIAHNETAGTELMKCRLENNYFAIFPSENVSAAAFLASTGLQQFRISRRMYLGQKRNWKPTGIFNRVSGQLG